MTQFSFTWQIRRNGRLISKGGNLSSPALEDTTFIFLKLEKELEAQIIIEMMRFPSFRIKSITAERW
jgi:hypothetical protein